MNIALTMSSGYVSRTRQTIFIVGEINALFQMSHTGTPAKKRNSHTWVSFVKHPIQVGFAVTGLVGGVNRSGWRIS